MDQPIADRLQDNLKRLKLTQAARKKGAYIPPGRIQGYIGANR
jgi:hypothetical protein